MDVFKEQIVRKKPSGNDTASKILIIIASVALAMMCFLFTLGTQLVLFGLLFAAAVLYGGYYLVTNLDVEYEYIFTNGEIDFDKIIAQRKRKRLCTVRINSATDFGVYDEHANLDGVETNVKANACDENFTDYFIRFNHKDLGDTVIYFTPDDDMLENLKPYLPRNIKAKM